jgi:hypothetical protein
MNFSDYKLTTKQINVLTLGKKHWSLKKDFLLKLIRSFNIPILNDDLEFFMEKFIPLEINRIKREYFEKSKSGILRTKYTPTDVKGDFKTPEKIEIGKKYHISWAFSGAVFKLKNIEDNICYLDNPKNKRKNLLKCKISELRELR